MRAGARGAELYQGIRECVLELPKLAGRIGWAYGDAVRQTVAEWEARFGEGLAVDRRGAAFS